LRKEAGRKKEDGQEDRPGRAENHHVGLDEVGLAGFQWTPICRYRQFTSGWKGTDRRGRDSNHQI
jgi:hypothetical protein